MAKAPVLTLNVGPSGAHEVDVYSTSRGRGVEIYVDGKGVTPTTLRTSTNGTERYEIRVDGIEPCTVRIEQKGRGRRATFQGYVDGWPAPDARAAARAARLEGATGANGAKKSARQRVRNPEKRVGRYLFAGLLLVLVFWGMAVFVRNQVNDASISSHGRAITAQVVDTQHVTDDDGESDYVWVWVPACSCPVRLATDNPSAHPKGSNMPVLYDTTDPTNARPLVDGNSKMWGWVLDVFFFGLAGFGLYCAYEIMSPEINRLRARRAAKSGTPPVVT